MSVIGEAFSGWVRAQIEDRNAKVALERDIFIDLDPGIAAAFQASTCVSRKYSTRLKWLFS